MREWTEKHILELIDKVAKQQGISQGGSGTPGYGFGLTLNDSNPPHRMDIYLNPALNPEAIAEEGFDGNSNYVVAEIESPLLYTRYYANSAGKAYSGDNALRPAVLMKLTIRLSNGNAIRRTEKVIGPYNNQLIGYVIGQPFDMTYKIRQFEEHDDEYGVTQYTPVDTPIPTLNRLHYSPDRLLTFTGTNGEIVTCTPTTLTGTYKLYASSSDRTRDIRTDYPYSIPAYELRMTCGIISTEFDPSTGVYGGPGVVHGVVTL